MIEKARELVGRMTLEEKAGLCSGRGYWHTKAVRRLGLPSVVLSDGPHGLRRQGPIGDRFGIGGSLPATCFPTASALACSFDPGLVREVGAAIAEEALAQGVSVVLGPGVNIKRGPLGGRNFEYFSEDPELNGALGAAFVRGVQERPDGSPTGVLACVKHYAANNQERCRMISDSVVDGDVLRSVYLRPFEIVVKEARPAAVMCSYNMINGVYASENRWLLTDMLRDRWGFDGLVVSDWGATADPVRGLAAGLDLEMPGYGGYSARRIIRAVHSGELPESHVDRAATNVAALALRAAAAPRGHAPDMYDRNHELARRAAARCAVLLKNDPRPACHSRHSRTPVLPLAPDARIAVIGEFARNPRFRGGGSSQVRPTRVETPWDALARDFPTATYAREGAEAVRAACAADVAIVFAGLPEGIESEAYDRETLAMPPEQESLIRAVSEACPRTVVVVQAGSPVDLEPAEGAAAILWAGLAGQACGGAVADILTGRVNPSGRLAETFPRRIEDTPCYGNFGTEDRMVRYVEGALVGRRWYEARGIEPAYQFGYGLSYKESNAGLLYAESNVGLSYEESNAGLSYKESGSAGKQRPSRRVTGAMPAARTPYTSNSTLKDIRRAPVGAVLYAIVRLALTLVYGTGYAGRRTVAAIADETPLRTISQMSGGLLPRGFIDAIIRLANFRI